VDQRALDFDQLDRRVRVAALAFLGTPPLAASGQDRLAETAALGGLAEP
jgi:hypothetical protein